MRAVKCNGLTLTLLLDLERSTMDRC